MRLYYIVVVFGWAFVLSYLQNRAKLDAGLGQSKVATGFVNFFWYVPLLNIAGLFAPSMFLGSEVVRGLRDHGKDRIWLRRVRLSCLGYLFVLFLPIFAVVPLVAAR
jgi:hypothetical protein